MSENLSIDEIIKRAEEIKKAAEQQLEAAEKSLDEKAKTAIDEVVVDEQQVVERIAKVYEKIDNEDNDVKEYVPPAKKEKKSISKTQHFSLADEDVKIAKPVTEEKEEKKPEVKVKSSDKTQKMSPLFSRSKKNQAPDNGKTQSFDLKDKEHDIYVSNTEPERENDLQEMPTIVAKNRIYDGFVESEDEEAQEASDNPQITFDGFDDAVESVPSIDEEVAEQILLERRQEKVGKFRLFGPDETDKDLGSDKVVKEDYGSINEKERFLGKFASKKASIRRRLILTIILAVPIILITLFKDSAYFPMFLSANKPYYICAAILYALVLIVNHNILVHGFNLKHGFNCDMPVAAVTVAVMAHTVICAVNEDICFNSVLLILAATFSLFMSQFGKLKMMNRIIDNFMFVSGNDDKFTVENIANTVDAEIICRGLLDSEPLVKTSVKTDLPSNFMEISMKRDIANRTAKIIFPIALILTAVLFFAIGVIQEFSTAFNMALCALVISVPCCTLYLGNTVLLDISKGLKDYNSRVCGFDGAAMACGANAMVMEAADLFGASSCEMHGFKTFDGTKVDDAIIYTAAVMTQTKSPLARVFDDVIIGKQSILPVVEDVTYENSMGISAWIYKRKVLVGNRDLLIRHNVDVPAKSFEKKYTIKGRKALYLAIDGNAAAMFIVSYSADPTLKRELRKLEKSGITIIVKSSDPYINEKSIAKLFALPEGFVRVMNYSAARVFDKYSNMHVEKSPAYVVHDGTAIGFVSAMRSAEIIMSSGRLITFLSCFGSAIGFATVALLASLEAFSNITATNIIIFQVIWNIFILMINKIKGLAQ